MTPDFPPWSGEFDRQAEKCRRAASTSLHQLEALFSPWIPRVCLATTDEGPFCRQRLWPLPLLFWTFLWQIAQAGASCREAIRQAKALCLLGGKPLPPDETSPYCQARAKLPLSLLQRLHDRVVREGEEVVPRRRLWHGHRVLAVDGTCLSLPDTPENQKRYPQQNVQKPGCGFPILRLLALFSLATGMIVSWATGSWYQNELTLLSALWGRFAPGDILLADRGFGNWTVLGQAIQRGLHVVARVNTAKRRVDLRQGRRLGRNDRLVHWRKPTVRPHYLDPKLWASLPPELERRVLRVSLALPGYRTRSVLLVTTLVDAQRYPAEALGRLYIQRWQMELCLRNLKSTLQMDQLSCKAPETVERELRLHLLVHNLVRRMMLEAAGRHLVDLERISFAGALAVARRFGEAMLVARTKKERCRLEEEMYRLLAGDEVPCRPGRREPRAVKRRPKPYPLLNRPRHSYREIPHRNRYRATAPRTKRQSRNVLN